MDNKQRAPRNRTISPTDRDLVRCRQKLVPSPVNRVELEEVRNRLICGDMMSAVDHLPDRFVDLLILDPPYNLTKSFNGTTFKKRTDSEYGEILAIWLRKLIGTLKPSASIYICGDWQTSIVIPTVAEKFFTLRNRGAGHGLQETSGSVIGVGGFS